MGYTLIVGEKPSVASSIASALGANKKQDGYFEGNGYYVSFAYGHLYSLADTKDYNPEMEKWDLKDYPFIPTQFKYKAINDNGVKKQIKTIKELVNKSELCICATDGDREGELIWAELKNDIKITKPIKRLWVTSHTPKDIEKGMNNLKDSMINLERAGYCRQQIDWILGINLTVTYTLKSGGEVTLKLGRVVLPTLKLIFDREVEIANFKSQTFYTLKTQFKADSESYIGTYYDKDNNSRILDKAQLLSIQKAIINQPGTVIKKESSKSTENAPKLFNLTDLQGHITSKFKGFTSDKVLEVMQSLYEKKHLTYPRTASRYLDDGPDNIKDAQECLNAVINIPELNINKAQVKFHSEKRVFDSSKVDSHPAIIPTYIVPDINSLSENEKIVYLEVTKRFVSHFLPAAVYDTVEILTKVGDYDFITRGKVLVEEGWKQLFKGKADQEEDPEDKAQEQDQEPEESITAKNVRQGDTVITGNSDIKEGKTNPPPHFTEKTLLAAMENCGKKVENEEELLKGYTIGTPATRGDTIKKLFDCGYIYSKGKNMLITDLGAKVIHYFPVKNLLKTSFTGQIEKTLKDIENGQYDSKAFMDKMIAYTVKNIEEMKASTMPVIKRPVNIIGICPDCGKNVIETDKAFSCEATRTKACKFTLWKEDKFFATFGKKLTEKTARELVNNKRATVKGMKSPKNEEVKFDAVVNLVKNPETGYWNYKLDFDTKDKGKGKGKSSSFKGKGKPQSQVKFKASKYQ